MTHAVMLDIHTYIIKTMIVIMEIEMTKDSQYHTIAEGVAELVLQKQKEYGNGVLRSNRMMLQLFPDGIPAAKYRDAFTLVRLMDKISKIAADENSATGEPWRDIAAYSLLTLALIEGDNKKSELVKATA